MTPRLLIDFFLKNRNTRRTIMKRLHFIVHHHLIKLVVYVFYKMVTKYLKFQQIDVIILCNNYSFLLVHPGQSDINKQCLVYQILIVQHKVQRPLTGKCRWSNKHTFLLLGRLIFQFHHVRYIHI